eukprot:scaffold291949_cov24-Tisochrysis_lutea.AAC.1
MRRSREALGECFEDLSVQIGLLHRRRVLTHQLWPFRLPLPRGEEPANNLAVAPQESLRDTDTGVCTPELLVHTKDDRLVNRR